MPNKPPVLPGGHHLVVYVPTEEHPDIDMPVTVESKCWLVKSYEEAIKAVEDFTIDDDFCVEVECRFEIFDEFLDPVGDQKLFMDLIQIRWDLEMGNEGTSDIPIRPLDAEEIETLFEEGRKETSTATSTDTKVYTPPKAETKEVKFDDIKVEDNR